MSGQPVPDELRRDFNRWRYRLQNARPKLRGNGEALPGVPGRLACPICGQLRPDGDEVRACMEVHRGARDGHFARWLARNDEEENADD